MFPFRDKMITQGKGQPLKVAKVENMNTIIYNFRKDYKADAVAYIERQSKQPNQSNSVYKRCVNDLAVELLETIESDVLELPTFDGLLFDNSYGLAVEKLLLNGARDWSQYSFGGCALVYNQDLERALLPPCRWGRYGGEWLLNYQAKALKGAYRNVLNALKHVGALEVQPLIHAVSDYYLSPSNLCYQSIREGKAKGIYNNTYIEVNQYSVMTANGKGKAILKRLKKHLYGNDSAVVTRYGVNG